MKCRFCNRELNEMYDTSVNIVFCDSCLNTNINIGFGYDYIIFYGEYKNKKYYARSYNNVIDLSISNLNSNDCYLKYIGTFKINNLTPINFYNKINKILIFY